MDFPKTSPFPCSGLLNWSLPIRGQASFRPICLRLRLAECFAQLSTAQFMLRPIKCVIRDFLIPLPLKTTWALIDPNCNRPAWQDSPQSQPRPFSPTHTHTYTFPSPHTVLIEVWLYSVLSKYYILLFAVMTEVGLYKTRLHSGRPIIPLSLQSWLGVDFRRVPSESHSPLCNNDRKLTSEEYIQMIYHSSLFNHDWGRTIKREHPNIIPLSADVIDGWLQRSTFEYHSPLCNHDRKLTSEEYIQIIYHSSLFNHDWGRTFKREHPNIIPLFADVIDGWLQKSTFEYHSPLCNHDRKLTSEEYIQIIYHSSHCNHDWGLTSKENIQISFLSLQTWLIVDFRREHSSIIPLSAIISLSAMCLLRNCV